jgi:heme-degrading monooxygenase HmoA
VITVINRLTVSGDTDAFERVLSGITGYMVEQPGFIDHTLYRSRNRPEVYVETARWENAESHRAAMQGSGFRDRVRELGSLASAEPDVFDSVAEDTATGAVTRL